MKRLLRYCGRREKGDGFISRENNALGGIKLRVSQRTDRIEPVKPQDYYPFDVVADYNFTLSFTDLDADDWYFTETFIPPRDYGSDVVKRNPDSDKYLTSPVYAGRFAGKNRGHKYVYLDMSRIEHLPEGVDEGDLIERGWMKAEPDFGGVAYCRFCGASLKDKRTGWLISTCPKCKEYNCYADFEMCVSC
jgi:hypothetical protein